MKTLYYFYYCCEGEQTVFVDGEGELVSAMHANDGNFRPEYMGFIPEFFGGQMVSIDIKPVEGLDEDDAEELVKGLRPAILKAIVASQKPKKSKKK